MHHDKLLTHWGRVTHISVSELTIIGSDNGLSPGQSLAIILNNAGLLLIEPLGTNFSEISIVIQTFSFKKMHRLRNGVHFVSASMCWYRICRNAVYYWLSKLSYHNRNSSSTEGRSIPPRIFAHSMYFPFMVELSFLVDSCKIFAHIFQDTFNCTREFCIAF